ncbi:MAG: hypothetical protein ACRDRU_21140 [Pseudonocardiaceae bacterium]
MIRKRRGLSLEVVAGLAGIGGTPHPKQQDYPEGLSQAILRQAGLKNGSQ